MLTFFIILLLTLNVFECIKTDKLGANNKKLKQNTFLSPYANEKGKYYSYLFLFG